MEADVSRVSPNLEKLLQETKSVHVEPEPDESLGGPFRVVNDQGGVLAHLDTEIQANEWIRENVRGKSWKVGDNDSTRDKSEAGSLKATELREPPK